MLGANRAGLHCAESLRRAEQGETETVGSNSQTERGGGQSNPFSLTLEPRSYSHNQQVWEL